MAYIKFCILTVETSLKDQSIYLTFNKEIDQTTLSYSNIILALNSNYIAPLATYDIVLGDDLKTLQLKFKDAPAVNQPYILMIQENIKDLEGNTLDKSLLRYLEFKSNVTSDVILKSPANFEIVEEQKFSWEERGDNPVNSFRLQVSTDTGFCNIVTDIVIKDQTSIVLGTPLKAGQYFYKIRAEVDDAFGPWCETRTFLVQQDEEYQEQDVSDDSTIDDDKEDVIVEDLVNDVKGERLIVEDSPKSGVTPSSFLFLFSEDIDPESLQVSVIRSDF